MNHAKLMNLRGAYYSYYNIILIFESKKRQNHVRFRCIDNFFLLNCSCSNAGMPDYAISTGIDSYPKE